jgi:hypothetical protein
LCVGNLSHANVVTPSEYTVCGVLRESKRHRIVRRWIGLSTDALFKPGLQKTNAARVIVNSI